MGASGAVSAVTGAYLVLFPQTLISVFWWFIFFINTIEIPAIYFIAFKLIIFDNLLEPAFAPPIAVAYTAHLSGYAFGMLSIIFMLSTKLITSTHYDVWDMIRQWNRRRQFRDVVSSGYDPFVGRPKFIKHRPWSNSLSGKPSARPSGLQKYRQTAGPCRLPCSPDKSRRSTPQAPHRGMPRHRA